MVLMLSIIPTIMNRIVLEMSIPYIRIATMLISDLMLREVCILVITLLIYHMRMWNMSEDIGENVMVNGNMFVLILDEDDGYLLYKEGEKDINTLIAENNIQPNLLLN